MKIDKKKEKIVMKLKILIIVIIMQLIVPKIKIMKKWGK
jgi:hypothetical protein